MKRDYKLYLNDIKESIARIEQYLKDISEEQFKLDVKLQDAVVRRLEIIGEASRNIPRSLKEKNMHVPWAKIEQYRDFIVHSYFEASLRRIWTTSTTDLKTVKEAMKNITMV